MGDFNLDNLKCELQRPTEKFVDIIYAISYIPIMNRSTGITIDPCILIDNDIRNTFSINDNFVNGIVTVDITYHYILFHIIKSNHDKMITSINTKLSEIINETRTSQLAEKVKNTDWSSLNSNRECQTHFSKFYTLFKTIYDGAFQLNRVKMLYRNHLPWLTGGLK